MIYADSNNNRYETNDATAARVVFFPQGGGFQCSLPHDVFHEHFKPAPEPTWRPGTVTAEWFATDDPTWPAYPCWSNGDLWNGWGMPAFTKATIDSMLTDFDTSGFSEKVRWVDGKLTVTEDEETYTLDPITIPGCAEPLYALGAGSWTWDAIVFNDELAGTNEET